MTANLECWFESGSAIFCDDCNDVFACVGDLLVVLLVQLLSACSNPGVALNSEPVIRATIPTDSAEAVEVQQSLLAGQASQAMALVACPR